MAEMDRPKRSLEGLFLAVLSCLIVILAVVYFKKDWLPTLASDRAGLDHLFYVILVVTGIAFVIVNLLFAYFIWRYSATGGQRASYWHDSRPLEITWTLATTVILSILVFMGLRLWAGVYSAPPADAYPIEITSEQFMWNVRYAGKDGLFGRLDPKLTTVDNPLGLDKNDPAAKDDVALRNQLYLPVNKPILIHLRSKDVLHSFFLPNFRVKQDAVPGMTINIWFVPKKVGDYEIACAELCGLGHYRMRGELHVLPQDEFDKWLESQQQEGQAK